MSRRSHSCNRPAVRRPHLLPPIPLPFFAGIALLLAAPLAASEPDPQRALQQWIEPLAATDQLYGAVLAQRGDSVVIEGAWGPADADAGLPNSPATRFEIGSIAKQMTAALVLLLEIDGHMRLDDPLTRHLELDATQRDAGERIRIADLLLHRSGLARDVVGVPLADEATRADVVAWALARPLRFAPGERTEYSNVGYVVLARVAEQATGEAFEELMQRRVFEHLEMRSNAFWDGATPLAGQARGYDPDVAADDSPGVRETPPRRTTLERGASGIVSTPRDLVRWMRGLPRLLGASAYREMVRDAGDGRGLGIGVYRRGDRRVVGHDGVTNGYTAFLEHYPDDDLIVVYTGNLRTAAFEYLEQALPAAAFGEELPSIEIPTGLEPARSPELIGRYEVSDALELEISRGERTLELMGTGGYPTALLRTEEGDYWYPSMYARIEVSRAADGTVGGLVWHDVHGGTFTIPRLDPAAEAPGAP